MVDSVEPPSASDSNVISIDLPIAAESHFPSAPGGVDSICREGKVFWSIRGTERKTDRQILAASGQNSEHFSRSSRVRYLIKAFAGVDERHPHRPCYVADDAVGGSNHVDGAKDSRVHPSIVNDEPTLPLSSVLCKRLSGKRWACPLTVSTNELP